MYQSEIERTAQLLNAAFRARQHPSAIVVPGAHTETGADLSWCSELPIHSKLRGRRALTTERSRCHGSAQVARELVLFVVAFRGILWPDFYGTTCSW